MESALTINPPQTCASNLLSANCSCPPFSSSPVRSCSCAIAVSANTTQFSNANLLANDCNCFNQNSFGNITQKCACCVAANNTGLLPK